jgi:hypothetical protein
MILPRQVWEEPPSGITGIIMHAFQPAWRGIPEGRVGFSFSELLKKSSNIILQNKLVNDVL